MQDFFGSVRRSLVFLAPDGDDGGKFGGLVERIGSSIRKSRNGLFSKHSVRALPPVAKEDAPPIWWRKGELIGCGAFGRVYMGMNLDSGELIAIKQVSIAANSASREKAQAHIRELEEEVKLLKNLSHPNIVRYLGTAREESSLNILLEFVPGGSISSLLGKFGSFPESVMKTYTKQLLLGLEYLHKNGIMHRDIKGANILVDNKGCIKLADFGASKKVVELATINGAKSMKGTPYWMAPEVILQTGHSFSADIWSVGCTVIEMATGKPPWSQQYQEVAALFHIGNTKSHPPIPEHLSAEAKDFLLKCLQEEPNSRPTASDLLQHPFVSCEYQEPHAAVRVSSLESGKQMADSRLNSKDITKSIIQRSTCEGLKDICEMGSLRCSSVFSGNYEVRSNWGSSNFEDDMCQIDDKNLFASSSIKYKSIISSNDLNKSFNPMCEPTDDWACKLDESSELRGNLMELSGIRTGQESTSKGNDFTFPCGQSTAEDDEEVTDSKIQAFLDEKALELKKLQTPLYEEFRSTVNAANALGAVGTENSKSVSNFLKLPPKCGSPSKLRGKRLSSIDAGNCSSRQSRIKQASILQDRALQEIQSPQIGEWNKLLHTQPESCTPTFSERQRKWKEELEEELKRKREMMRRGTVGAIH
ncbi:mitogen-activated protein kinase kinase kinase NPK1 isoform X2 [Cucurbita maxima]|uniref:mitogen-activated protein kinase kinase kinase n=1 Tax=Cucurbita maxima TaxID=3661 RepID=A0A6J1KXU2_CUCMA|nr:mitogen-activated protein kinase kinase kinase NPK1 isoform X2 [Cucurbita maxima]